jgi:hypothetical protein
MDMMTIRLFDEEMPILLYIILSHENALVITIYYENLVDMLKVNYDQVKKRKRLKELKRKYRPLHCEKLKTAYVN